MINIKIPHSQKIENVLGVIIISVIIGFIGYLFVGLYKLTFQSSDTSFMQDVIAAFAGAFFAFLFLRMGEVLEKYYQRQVKHFNALVSMEIYLDELGSIIHDNIYQLPSFRQTINGGNVYASTIRPLPIRRDYYEQLHDIKLINDLYKLNYDIRRINDDLDSATSWYSHLKQLYTTGQMAPAHYIENAKILSENLKVIQAALTLLIDEAIRLNAITKLRLESDKPLLTRLMHFIIDKTRQDITNKQIKKRMKAVKAEVEKSGEDSQPRIEKIKELVSEMD